MKAMEETSPLYLLGGKASFKASLDIPQIFDGRSPLLMAYSGSLDGIM